jgi:hypothetical protein
MWKHRCQQQFPSKMCRSPMPGQTPCWVFRALCWPQSHHQQGQLCRLPPGHCSRQQGSKTGACETAHRTCSCQGVRTGHTGHVLLGGDRLKYSPKIRTIESAWKARFQPNVTHAAVELKDTLSCVFSCQCQGHTWHYRVSRLNPEPLCSAQLG